MTKLFPEFFHYEMQVSVETSFRLLSQLKMCSVQWGGSVCTAFKSHDLVSRDLKRRKRTKVLWQPRVSDWYSKGIPASWCEKEPELLSLLMWPSFWQQATWGKKVYFGSRFEGASYCPMGRWQEEQLYASMAACSHLPGSEGREQTESGARLWAWRINSSHPLPQLGLGF